VIILEEIITRVLIVGAGPAGLGVASALKRAGLVDLLVVDAEDIGASFKKWPAQMRFITPGFYSNPFNLPDLNSIDPETSPTDFFRTEHLTGKQYAAYLEAVVDHYQIPVKTGIKVVSLEKKDGMFSAKTSQGEIQAEYVVWATGQFSTPRDKDFLGAELAIHNSQIADWNELGGDEFTVIGGYESGVDAALNLVDLGKSVRLISRGEPWANDNPDPSRSLSPRTLDRLRGILRAPEKASLIEFIKGTEIQRIEKSDSWWTLYDQDGFPHTTLTRPILANGFTGGLSHIKSLFEEDSNGLPIFSEDADESTLTPNLFYSGPELVHRNALFCFVYKFRARFGVIAHEIASRCGKPEVDEKLLPYLKNGFMNTDLDCCYVDPVILVLVTLLFFEISFGKLSSARQHLPFLSIAWVANFVIIPLIAWGIATLFLSGKPAIYLGLLLYLIVPCTDWFLGFTRLAKGNVILGSVLLPINLISQLLLFPVYLYLFVGGKAGVDSAGIVSSVWQWFLIPFLIGIVLNQVCQRIFSAEVFAKILSFASALIPFVIGILVACIFAGNVTTILENATTLPVILLAVFVFFVATYILGELLARRFRLAYPERTLLVMTTSARNAPLMLGLATIIFPDQPLVYAALIIGMLVEFPHLTILKHFLLRQRNLTSSQGGSSEINPEEKEKAALHSA